MQPNPVLQTLRSGGVSIGTMFLEIASPGTCRIASQAGYDFLILDTEHSWRGVESIAWMLRAARDIGLPAIVRAPAFEGQWLTRYLDLGAAGLVIPRVESADEAARIVDKIKYPPVGTRGMANGLALDDFCPQPMPEFVEWANTNILLALQIETAKGVANRDEILATPGVDALFIGPNDLSLSMGYPGQLQHPEVIAAIEETFTSAQAHGVAPGMHMFDVPTARRWIERGARFVCYSADISFIIQSSRRDLAEIRGE